MSGTLTTLRDSSQESLAALATQKRLRKTDSLILLFSMGSQFDHLIVGQYAKLGVYCLVADPTTLTAQDVRRVAPQGITVSGGPASVATEPPPFDERIFDLGIPTLGICLGFQMWAKHVGADVGQAPARELNVQRLTHTRQDPLWGGIPDASPVLQSHGDVVTAPHDPQFITLGSTEHSPVAAARRGHLWGVQFHPEVSDTQFGAQMFNNFATLCGIVDRYPAHSVVAQKVEALRAQVGDKRVLLALSGGSDSSVVAHLLKAAGATREKVRGVYIKGIDRPDDEADVLRLFGNEPWIELRVLDAREAFLRRLAGITSSREKRVAVREVYVQALEEEIRAFGAHFIAQGTLYTDLVESGHGHQTGARRAQIKLHHNVGLRFSIPELTPLSDCVKDNARGIGRDIGVPEELLVRHPFPGVGLAVRVEGEVTQQKLDIARAADGILMQELRAAGLYEEVWQAGARVSASMHTTTAGDDAGVGCVVMWFAVSSVNGFTARAYDIPYPVRQRIADRLGNEIRGVGATAFRDSGKPYSTIEGE
jgi:GMP synthase (glutamine-hydrolysing)